MTFRKSFDCYDFYDRAKVGEKCTQDDWDLMKIPMKAMELKQKYGTRLQGRVYPDRSGYDGKSLPCGIRDAA